MIFISEFLLIANRLRLRADELRILAETCVEESNKEVMLEVAECYERSAENYIKRHKFLKFKSFLGRWT